MSKTFMRISGSRAQQGLNKRRMFLLHPVTPIRERFFVNGFSSNFIVKSLHPVTSIREWFMVLSVTPIRKWF